ncbi:CDP-alcohol phosphatidyltransferase family protein [Amycolatopsis magusensis]|uniref:CDP-alcohol phosphatidyltransferase family protein n=1 Tax=Amycolatopsis magusensis TaxID=882444 RepID=UPI0037AC8A28
MSAGEDSVRGWSRLHGEDVSGNRVAVGWIRLVHLLARPVARVPPDVLSAAGVLSTAGAVVAAWRWPWVALVLVVLGGVLDGVDGAVALRAGRARPLGAVVDAVADRLSDVGLAAVLVALGGDFRWAAAIVVAMFLHEYARARAQGAGMSSAGAITVAERPTRVVIVAVACLGAAVFPAGTPWTRWPWASVCLALWSLCALVGGAQLVAGIRRALAGRTWPGSGMADEPGDDLR